MAIRTVLKPIANLTNSPSSQRSKIDTRLITLKSIVENVENTEANLELI